jgi:hypothetical protein
MVPSAQKSNDPDLVPNEQYRHIAVSRLPPEYEKLRTMPTYEPLKLDPIINSGPNLPRDLDIDDPVAFWRLFWTDEVLQYLATATNLHAEVVRRRGGSGATKLLNSRPWTPIDQIDIEIYLGTSSPPLLLSITKNSRFSHLHGHTQRKHPRMVLEYSWRRATAL